MRKLLPLLLATGLAACATAHEPKAAVCDGKHRRPANPNGSVLPDAPLAPSAAAPQPAPGPLSLVDPGSFQPCGSGR